MSLIFFVLAVFFSAGDRQANAAQDPALSGAWWSMQGGNYSETIFTDSVMWTYNELAGPLHFTYHIEDSVIMRYIRPWKVRAASMTIRSIAADTMVVSCQGQQITFIRNELNLDKDAIRKLIEDDPETIAAYRERFRKRARERQHGG